MLGYKLVETFKQGLVIKPCKYCKRLFSPEGRSDIEYCDRIADGETKPCNQIGAVKLHYKDKENDVIHKEFLTAYRRMSSRVRKDKMTKDEFIEWSKIARKKRDECYDGKLELGEFKKWLGNK